MEAEKAIGYLIAFIMFGLGVYRDYRKKDTKSNKKLEVVKEKEILSETVQELESFDEMDWDEFEGEDLNLMLEAVDHEILGESSLNSEQTMKIEEDRNNLEMVPSIQEVTTNIDEQYGEDEFEDEEALFIDHDSDLKITKVNKYSYQNLKENKQAFVIKKGIILSEILGPPKSKR